jgi:hypothetical protein
MLSKVLEEPTASILSRYGVTTQKTKFNLLTSNNTASQNIIIYHTPTLYLGHPGFQHIPQHTQCQSVCLAVNSVFSK